MQSIAEIEMTRPSQVFVPVRADGQLIRDNGGDVIATCFTADLAARIAHLINTDSGAMAMHPDNRGLSAPLIIGTIAP